MSLEGEEQMEAKLKTSSTVQEISSDKAMRTKNCWLKTL